MATNYANATYTEVIDLQTVPDTVSIIGIHTPLGYSPYRRLRGFFDQFRKFKYNGIKSLVMIPAAQLPIDPLGLTGVPGTTDLMDPRDALNPILFHGCHGESLTTILDEIYGTVGLVNTASGNVTTVDGNNVAPSADEFKQSIATGDAITQYYGKLTDSSWRKFGIQQGVKLSNMRPLVWQVAQNMPTLPSATTASGQNAVDIANRGKFAPISERGTDGYMDYPANETYDTPGGPTVVSVPRDYPVELPNYVDGTLGMSIAYKQQFTNRMTTLGWMPTAYDNGLNTGGQQITQTMLPKLFCGVLVMPPSYNIQQFFRMVIVHSFSFKDFTSSLGLMGSPGVLGSESAGTPYRNWIDYGDSKDVKFGDTLDTIGASADVVSDGVM